MYYSCYIEILSLQPGQNRNNEMLAAIYLCIHWEKKQGEKLEEGVNAQTSNGRSLPWQEQAHMRGSSRELGLLCVSSLSPTQLRNVASATVEAR